MHLETWLIIHYLDCWLFLVSNVCVPKYQCQIGWYKVVSSHTHAMTMSAYTCAAKQP